MHTKKHHTLVHSPGLNPKDWLRFVQLDPFPGQWSRLKLSEEDLNALEICIMAFPLGDVIPGTSGLRKVRFSPPRSHRGTRGSYRVYFVHFKEYGTVVLWAIIDKAAAKDLSKAERNAIAMQNQRLKNLLDRGVIR